jgi:hypothetical protein
MDPKGKGIVINDNEKESFVNEPEREMCPWAISKYFGDLVSNTSA